MFTIWQTPHWIQGTTGFQSNPAGSLSSKCSDPQRSCGRQIIQQSGKCLDEAFDVGVVCGAGDDGLDAPEATGLKLLAHSLLGFASELGVHLDTFSLGPVSNLIGTWRRTSLIHFL